jgi:hypothetical protein
MPHTSFAFLPFLSDKYKKSQRTAAGADKWLDTRLWDSTADCLGSLKAAGYQIVTTHLSASSVTVQVRLGCAHVHVAAAAQLPVCSFIADIWGAVPDHSWGHHGVRIEGF